VRPTVVLTIAEQLNGVHICQQSATAGHVFPLGVIICRRTRIRTSIQGRRL